MIINEIVPSAYGAEVGRAIKDPAEQVAAMDVLAKAHPPNIEQARMIVRDVVESGFLKGEQSNLFGTEALVQGLFAERARILDSALRSLRQMSKTFNTAIEHEGVLSKVGNVLSKEANAKGKMSNDAFSEILKILKKQSNVSSYSKEVLLQICPSIIMRNTVCISRIARC